MPILGAALETCLTHKGPNAGFDEQAAGGIFQLADSSGPLTGGFGIVFTFLHEGRHRWRGDLLFDRLELAGRLLSRGWRGER